jgi:L-threonylcarbamoyladenylate synthase
VPGEVTAGLATVAVRVPAHAVAHALLAAAGVPVAAPSANLFGQPSPTAATHVLDDLDGWIDAVLDGGLTPVGVESTIVDVSTGAPRLLRAGGIAVEVIEAVLGQTLDPPPAARHGPQLAPGLLPAHYAPRTPLVLVGGAPAAAQARLVQEVAAALAGGQQIGVVALADDTALLDTQAPSAQRVIVGAWATPAESAAQLFAALRTLDARGLDAIYARELAPPGIGLGRALADRLRRAARTIIIATAN